MSNAAKVHEFLNKAQVFYFLTTDGDQPKGRPFGFQMLVNDTLYFGCGTFKNVFHQLTANPKVEVLAVSGDEAANILACQIANKLGVKHTVCRLYSNDCFSEDDGISPATYGLWRTFSSPEESAEKILAVLANPITLETITFTHPDAAMIVIEIRKPNATANPFTTLSRIV